jgi:hypothetical protein
LYFATIIFLKGKFVSLASNPHNLEDQVPVFMSLSYRMAQLYLQAPVSIFLAFYYGGRIPPSLHRGSSGR